MIINRTKYEVLKDADDESLNDDINYLTPNAEDIIERKEVVRYLGILMNDKVAFDDQM